MLIDPASQVKEFAVSKWKNGVTLVGDRYFYTEWHDSMKQEIGRMLYDHEVDPDENVNIAEREENKELVAALGANLNENLADDYWEPATGEYSRD
jgi:hypothetical protein